MKEQLNRKLYYFGSQDADAESLGSDLSYDERVREDDEINNIDVRPTTPLSPEQFSSNYNESKTKSRGSVE